MKQLSTAEQTVYRGFPGVASGKNPTANAENKRHGCSLWAQVYKGTSQALGQEDPLEEAMSTHSSILAWKITWTEEPGRLQSIRLQQVRHDWNNIACTHTVHIYVNANLQIHPTGCFLARCLYVYSLCLWQLTFELRTRASDVGKHLPGPEQCQS